MVSFLNTDYVKPLRKQFASLNLKASSVLRQPLDILYKNIEFIISSESESESEEEVVDDYNHQQEIHTVLAIDIGIRNLALTLCTMDSEYNFIDIVGVDLVDITTFPHKEDEENCKLKHTKTFADWLEHIFEYYDIVFENADHILLEKQPPTGIVGIEQLLFYKYRHKAILISPNSMHKYLHIGHLDYEQRKIETMKIFVKHVRLINVIEDYNSFERKHDIADAFCLAKFWLDKKHQEFIAEKERERIRNIEINYRGSDMTLEEWFEQFRYRSKIV